MNFVSKSLFWIKMCKVNRILNAFKFLTSKFRECSCGPGFVASPLRGWFCWVLLWLWIMMTAMMMMMMKWQWRWWWAGGNDCIDVDECLVGNGGCEQDCHNTEGGHRCTCRWFLTKKNMLNDKKLFKWWQQIILLMTEKHVNDDKK